jgi:ferredoxin--NADP+ reductase
VVQNVTDEIVPSLYVVGWLKRGATGVIGTNRADAAETTAAMLAECNRLDPIEQLIPPRHPVITTKSWARIDEEERRLGEAASRIRRKLAQQAAIDLGAPICSG